jgi:hypothetical protein
MLRKNESFPERPIIIVLYGTPGVGKTSLLNTCEAPVLIDCDRGADRACNRAEGTIVATKWQDVLTDESEIKQFKTVGIDTAKAVLDDFLMVYVVEKDYKLKTNKLKAYGAIGDEFKSFINVRRSEGLDIVIIAHAKEEKDGDILRLSPDVTGQSKDLILRIADQVGFVTMVNNKRTITFEPTDKTIGKNVARIPTMEIPDEKSEEFKTFGADLIAKVKSSIRTQSEEQIQAQDEMNNFSLKVDSCENSDDLVSMFDDAAKMKEYQKAAARKLIAKRADDLGLKFDVETKKFIAK